MNRIRLTYLLIVLSCTLFHGSVFAEITSTNLYVLKVYPTQPSTQDSVFVSLTYTSNDGCPDYYLEIDSVESSFISIVTRKIDNSTKFCTLAIEKFVTKINLGLLHQSTQIYVDGVLIQTINPNCTLDRKGVIVKGTGSCSGKLFISEHTLYLSAIPILYTLDKVQARNADSTASTGFKAGDEVTFGAILRAPSTNNTCRIVGDAVCCEIISTKPDCLMNKTGVIVPGIDGCTGQWFIKDLSPVYSYPRLYLINEGPVKAGAKVIFGSTDYPKDSSMSILCPIFGIVNCFIFSEPVMPDTLAGTAYTGDSILKSGTAILFQRSIRKALRAVTLENGRFVFPNLPTTEYTVYVIPDKTLNTNYLPTFYINKLAYKNADYYSLKDGMNEIAVNLRSFVKRPGKGKIYGNVYFETANLKDSILNYYGDKKYLYTTDNNMAINLPIILFDSQGAPIDWTMSDNSGNYAFDNIALDSYRIVTESAESQAESTVSLTPENAVVGANMVLKIQTVIDELPAIQSESFSLYPNPVSDKLFIQTITSNAVRIYNSLGQLMMERYLPVGKNELDVQHLNQGVYFVKMGMYTQKMIRK